MNTEIIKKQLKVLKDNPRIKAGTTIVVEGAGTIAGIANPIAPFVVDTFKTVASCADEIKLDKMLKGLANGKNVETTLNELYSFVKDSDERAFLVSNLFRQTLLTQSPKVCCIYGIILSEIKEKGEIPDYDQLIIFNALQTATDYEIRFFKDIVENYIGEDGLVNEDKIHKDKLEIEALEYYTTLEWCKNNRIFGISNVKKIGGFTIFDEFFEFNSRAEKLIDYINKAEKILDYDRY